MSSTITFQISILALSITIVCRKISKYSSCKIITAVLSSVGFVVNRSVSQDIKFFGALLVKETTQMIELLDFMFDGTKKRQIALMNFGYDVKAFCQSVIFQSTYTDLFPNYGRSLCNAALLKILHIHKLSK